MEISKLTFKKETKDKMSKQMSVRKKGKILFARLQELEADGTLSKAKTRADVARLVGYPEERAKAGYSWVSNLISRGHVSETIQEWTPSGKMIAEYHTTGSMPFYDYGEAAKRREKKQTIAKKAEEVIRQGLPLTVSREPVELSITKGELTIQIKNIGGEQITTLVKQLLTN